MLTLLLLRWIHILAAIAVVGLHATYGVWIVRGSSRRETLAFALKTIILLDSRVALPALAAQLITGFAMVGITRVPMGTPWLLTGVVLFALVVLAHLLVYRPTLRRMPILLEGDGMESTAFQAAANRERNLGIAMTAVMIVIVFLMVIKPRLWG